MRFDQWQRRILTFGILVTVLGVTARAGEDKKRPAASLTPQESKQALAAAAFYAQGDSGNTLGVLAKLVGRLSKEKIAALDQVLTAKKAPPAAKVLSQARWSSIVQGHEKRMPRMTPREAVLVLPEMDRSLRETIQQIQGKKIMADPLPQAKTVQQYEDLLQQANVLGRRMEAIDEVAQFMAQGSSRVSQRLKARLDDADQKVLNTDYGRWADKVTQLLEDLREREIELRIRRLEFSLAHLKQPAMTKEKFLSAYTWSTDASVILGFLQGDTASARRAKAARAKEENAGTRKYGREILNEKGLENTIRRNAGQARELSGSLALKAKLLFEGLNWWIRGRYGIGPERFGLAKSPLALVSPAAQMGLFMPADIPTPTDPQQVRQPGQASPQFDRRHHYWWVLEDRRIYRNYQADENTQYDWQNTPVTKTRTFW